MFSKLFGEKKKEIKTQSTAFPDKIEPQQMPEGVEVVASNPIIEGEVKDTFYQDGVVYFHSGEIVKTGKDNIPMDKAEFVAMVEDIAKKYGIKKPFSDTSVFLDRADPPHKMFTYEEWNNLENKKHVVEDNSYCVDDEGNVYMHVFALQNLARMIHERGAASIYDKRNRMNRGNDIYDVLDDISKLVS